MGEKLYSGDVQLADSTLEYTHVILKNISFR